MNLLEMKKVRKSFHSVEVLHGVDLTVRAGTVHALMGENGAGKSTLMKVLAGVHGLDSGEVYIRGEKVEIQSPKHSQELGVAMIHQELSAIPEMTVAENIFLGREPRKGIFIDHKKMQQMTQELLDNLKVAIAPSVKIGRLKVADQQLVEIAKAVSFHADIIVMDEPTSAITDNEVEYLFQIIADLKAQGKGIIYISHKMDEIFRIADDITVLRDGNYVNTWEAKDINNNILIQNMVGRELNEYFPKVEVPIHDVLFEVKHLTQKGKFEDVSFVVKKGEIFGIAGLIGAGRTEMMQAIFGLAKLDEGEMYLEGVPITIHTPKEAIAYGIAYVTEDRKGEGLVLEMPVAHNITLPSMKMFCQNGFISAAKEKSTVEEEIEALRIKVHTPAQLAGKLSGGNQQKIVLAKWMMKHPKLLILDEPTRGIDVGAKSEIYKLMCEYVAKGNSIIMISSEMPEVMGMADRIMVMSNGIKSGELTRKEFAQETIMKLAVSNI